MRELGSAELLGHHRCITVKGRRILERKEVRNSPPYFQTFVPQKAGFRFFTLVYYFRFGTLTDMQLVKYQFIPAETLFHGPLKFRRSGCYKRGLLALGVPARHARSCCARTVQGHRLALVALTPSGLNLKRSIVIINCRLYIIRNYSKKRKGIDSGILIFISLGCQSFSAVLLFFFYLSEVCIYESEKKGTRRE